MNTETRNCQNCRAALQGKFCSECGQEDHPQNVTVKQIFSDFIDDYFTLDSKLFKSFIPLLFKPGFLTLEYFKGRRAGYVKPFRIYIITSIVFFFMTFLTQGDYAEDIPTELANLSESMETEIEAEDDGWTFSLDTDSTAVNSISFLDVFLEDRGDRLEEMSNEEINQHMKNFFQNNIPKALFVLLPIFAFVLKIFFWKQRKFYLEHLIYALHFQSFLYIMLALMIVFSIITKGFKTGMFEADIPHLLLLLSIFIYSAISIRRVYDQGYAMAITKMFGVVRKPAGPGNCIVCRSDDSLDGCLVLNLANQFDLFSVKECLRDLGL